jgi:hypothetical protein
VAFSEEHYTNPRHYRMVKGETDIDFIFYCLVGSLNMNMKFLRKYVKKIDEKDTAYYKIY